MNPSNDIRLDTSQSWQLQSQPPPLTAPPIQLQKPAPKKKGRRRRRRVRKKAKKWRPEAGEAAGDLYSDGQLGLSPLGSQMSYTQNDRIAAVKSVFKPLIMMQGSGYAVLLPVMWYYQHCSSDEGSLTHFDNMLAYTITIVSLGCVVFSREVQNTYPYNVIYPLISVCATGYLFAKISCARELILMLEMAALVGIEGLTIYLIAIYTSKDFTPLTPILTAVYVGTTVLNILVLYLVQDSVPVVMLSIINLFLTFGLCICIAQFPVTTDARYRLPPVKSVYGGFMMYYAINSLSYHTYLIIAAVFDVYGSKKFEYYVVNLTFYLEK